MPIYGAYGLVWKCSWSIAGGHSLVPLMKLRLSEPAVLIDVARIPGLSGIKEKDGKIEIGAATTHREVAASALLKQVCPVIADTAIEIGDPQVRNRGTLGGSLAHADPAADYPAVMLAVDARNGIRLSSLLTSTTDARISARSTAVRLLRVGRATPGFGLALTGSPFGVVCRSCEVSSAYPA